MDEKIRPNQYDEIKDKVLTSYPRELDRALLIIETKYTISDAATAMKIFNSALSSSLE